MTGGELRAALRFPAVCVVARDVWRRRPTTSEPPYQHRHHHHTNHTTAINTHTTITHHHKHTTTINQVHLYKKGLRGKAASKAAYSLDDPELPGLLDADLWEQLQEDVELLEVRA